MAITRLNYVSLNVISLDECERHYTEVIGLRVTDRRPGRIYLQAHEAQDHHCVVLNQSDRAGLDHMGFKVTEAADLDEAEAAARAGGLACHRAPAGELVGQSAGLRITLPTGHVINLFQHAAHVGYSTGMRDPDPVIDRIDGINPVTHVDHLLVAGPNVRQAAAFMREALDFGVTETIVAPDGAEVTIFLTVGNTMHNIALAEGPTPGALHHIAFYVHDRADVIRRVDMLKHRGVPTLRYGLTRHGVAGVTTTYFHDPSGNQNEFQCGVYQTSGIPDAVPPVRWDFENIPRGVFYYENQLFDEFFAVTT